MPERVVLRNVKRLPIRPGNPNAGAVCDYLTANVDGEAVAIAVDPELVSAGRPMIEALPGKPEPIPEGLRVVEWPELYRGG